MSTDLGKLLREKLEATTLTVTGASNVTWSNVNNPNTWEPVRPLKQHMEEVKYMLDQMDYILQRIVPNYDELVAQYRAVKDIEEAGK